MARQRKQIRSFIRFVNERQRIHERRHAGDPWPWTGDPVLRRYKFCNVFRHLDRESQSFLELAAPGDVDPLHALFRAALWTGFNKGETWRRLAAAIDLDKWDKPSDLAERVVPVLHERVDALRADGVTMFTGSYSLPPWKRYGDTLSRAAVNFAAALVDNKWICGQFTDAESLFDAASTLTALHGIGSFFAWQIAINAWWTKAFQFRDDGRALVGGGSLAGLRLLGDGDKYRVFERVLTACRKWGPTHDGAAMGAVDAEHALCEWYKYVDPQERRRDGKTHANWIYKPPEQTQNKQRKRR